MVNYLSRASETATAYQCEGEGAGIAQMGHQATLRGIRQHDTSGSLLGLILLPGDATSGTFAVVPA